MDSSRIFTREQVISLLNAAMGKTLLEVDSRHLFIQYEKENKVTGIAGNIVEQSILGCKQDNRQDVDIDDIRPLSLHLTGMSQSIFYRNPLAPIRKGIRGHVQDAHNQGALPQLKLSRPGQVIDSLCQASSLVHAKPPQ